MTPPPSTHHERAGGPATVANDELLAALVPLVDATGSGRGTVLESRRPNEYMSSSRSEVVALRLPAGEIRELLVKYRRDAADPEPRCRHGVDYCFAVYREALARLPLTRLEALGLIDVGAPPTRALVLEYLPDCLRVSEAPDESGIVAAAEWFGRFHRWGESFRDDPAVAFLARYDPGYYTAWSVRSARIAARAAEPPAWLPAVCAAYERLAARLVTAEPTLVHGECSPQNVLWKEGAIYPVDWESAAVAAGEIDLAALLFGWQPDTIDRCIAAYWRARGMPQPAGFSQIWAAATLYTALRWVRPATGPDDAAARKSWAAVERVGRDLGII